MQINAQGIKSNGKNIEINPKMSVKYRMDDKMLAVYNQAWLLMSVCFSSDESRKCNIGQNHQEHCVY